jgi:hypothetical protein
MTQHHDNEPHHQNSTNIQALYDDVQGYRYSNLPPSAQTTRYNKKINPH